MKKIFIKISIYLLLLSISGVFAIFSPQSVYAQELDPGEAPDYSSIGINQGRGDIGSVITLDQIRNDPALGAGTRTSTGKEMQVVPSWSVSGLIIGVVGYFLYITISLFNAAIDNFVLGMGYWIQGPLKQSIDLVWVIVRDLVNLTFIFGLVYVGFKTILNAGSDTKKMLASIIVGALLVNFSLFIAKVVIDVSNVTAIQIYNNMGIGENANGTNLEGLNVGTAFMAQMGLINLIAVPDPNVKNKMIMKTGGWNTDGDGMLPFTVGLAAFVITASFVFASAALLIAIRFAVLLVVMMLSPIAFAASVFPALESYSKKWWKTLFEQSFFAPALFFMLYLTMKVAEGYSAATQNFDGIFVGDAAQKGFTTAAFFVLTIILMVASLIIAKQMGAYGANFSTRMGARLAAGTVGAIGRNTIGRWGNIANDSKALNDAASKGGVRGLAAKAALKSSRYVAKSSFDVRATLDKSGLTKLSGLDLGKPQKGGYEQRQKDIIKQETEFAKSLGQDTDAVKKAEVLHKEQIENLEADIKVRQRAKTQAVAQEKQTLSNLLRQAGDRNLTEGERAAYRAQADAQKLVVERIETEHNTGINEQEEEKKRLLLERATEVEKVKNERQRNYAEVLKQGGSFSPTFLRQTKAENAAAAEAIEKDRKKTPEEKRNESLLAALEKSKKNSDD